MYKLVRNFLNNRFSKKVALSRIEPLNSDPPSESLQAVLDKYNQGALNEALAIACGLELTFPRSARLCNVQGGIYSSLNEMGKSLASYQKAVTLEPQYAQAYSNMGNVHSVMGNPNAALDCFKQATLILPDYAEAYYNMGLALERLNRFHEAEANYREAVALKPNLAGAFSNLGNVLHKRGVPEEAEECYHQAILLNPEAAEPYSNLGNLLRELNRASEAETSYRKAISLDANLPEAHNNLGGLLQELDRYEEAEVSLSRAIAIKPTFAEAHSSLGVILQKLGRLDGAEASCRQAIILKSDFPEGHSNLGATLQLQGRLKEAESSYRMAVALRPDYAEAIYNLGNIFKELGRLDEAKASYKQAILLKADYAEAHLNLGFTLLQSDSLEEGLNEYEWRWKIPKNLSKNRYFAQPLWDGKESLQDKRILLWSEQGIGDTLNWASCLPLLAAKAEHTILECQEKIVSLLARSFPNIDIRPEDRSKDSQREDFDFHLPMGSLYRHFAPNIGKNSNIDAYLIPDPARVKFWRDRLTGVGKGPYIGVCWKSSTVSDLRLKHYPPISDWASVLKIPDVTFINLQYSDFAGDLTKIADDMAVTIHNFDDLDQFNNVDEVAALCRALDMVVTTKVTPMIFSSGVGTPTKIANWRQSIFNTVLTNPVSLSADIYNRDTHEPWDIVFRLIAEDVFELKNRTALLKNKP